MVPSTFDIRHSSFPLDAPAGLIDAAFPSHALRGEAAPAIEADPKGKQFADGVQNATQPGRAETTREHHPNEVNDGDLRDDQRPRGVRSEEEDEREQEAATLRGADEEEAGEGILEGGANGFGKAFPCFA